MTNNIVGGKRRSRGKNKKALKGKKKSGNRKRSKSRSSSPLSHIFDSKEKFSLSRNDVNNLLPLMYLLN